MSKPILVIACGKKKRPPGRKYPLWDLYLGPLWSTYRKWLADHDIERRVYTLDSEDHWVPTVVAGTRPSPVDVWVLSAAFGLAPDYGLREPYDFELTARGVLAAGGPVYRSTTLSGERRDPSTFEDYVHHLANNMCVLGRPRDRIRKSPLPAMWNTKKITFAGPRIYARALREASALGCCTLDDCYRRDERRGPWQKTWDPAPQVEDLGGRGWGGMRHNLRAWLDRQLQLQQGGGVDLDAILDRMIGPVDLDSILSRIIGS